MDALGGNFAGGSIDEAFVDFMDHERPQMRLAGVFRESGALATQPSPHDFDFHLRRGLVADAAPSAFSRTCLTS